MSKLESWSFFMHRFVTVKELIEKKLLFLGKNVIIEEFVTLCKPDKKGNTNPVYIGDNCILKTGSIIYSGCRLGRNVTVGYYTVIKPNCIIESGCIIPNHSTIQRNLLKI